MDQTLYEEPVAIDRGEGSYVFDSDGNRYLDCFGGVLTTMIGHSVPEVVAAVGEQAAKVMHTSTLYLSEPMIAFAEEVAAVSGIPDAKVFFTTSGTEANDTALLPRARLRAVASRRSALSGPLGMPVAPRWPEVPEGVQRGQARARFSLLARFGCGRCVTTDLRPVGTGQRPEAALGEQQCRAQRVVTAELIEARGEPGRGPFRVRFDAGPRGGGMASVVLASASLSPEREAEPMACSVNVS